MSIAHERVTTINDASSLGISHGERLIPEVESGRNSQIGKALVVLNTFSLEVAIPP